jgi:hypothetical protein
LLLPVVGLLDDSGKGKDDGSRGLAWLDRGDVVVEYLARCFDIKAI